MYAIRSYYVLPPGIGDARKILPYQITIGEGSIVETRDDDDLLIPFPSLKGNDPIGVRLVKDVNIVTSDRAQPATERDESYNFV